MARRPTSDTPSSSSSSTRPRLGDALPSREEMLAFLAENPGAAGKREIARAFGITGGAKIALKRVLKELEIEGVVEKRHKKLAPKGALTQVFVADVTRRDPDGELDRKSTRLNSSH